MASFNMSNEMYSSIADVDQQNRLRHTGYKHRPKVQHSEKNVNFGEGLEKNDLSNTPLRFEKSLESILNFKDGFFREDDDDRVVTSGLASWTDRADVQNSTFLYYNWSYEIGNVTSKNANDSVSSSTWWDGSSTPGDDSESEVQNWWALLALFLVLATAAGNILVCLAICWERRLQNVTNYFLMSLAVTDLMVAVLVMPIGILTLFKGEFFAVVAY